MTPLIATPPSVPNENSPSLKSYMDAYAASSKLLKCILCGYPLCNHCGACEWPECKLYTHSITTKEELATKRHLLACTQKARGFVALGEKGKVRIPTPYFMVIEETDVEGLWMRMHQSFLRRLGKSDASVFVRPCPKNPRHGFVESRDVEFAKYSTHPERFEKKILGIFREARKADSEAELLILPRINAEWSLTFVPSRFAVGPGHDGSTAGKNSIDIPLMGVPFPEIGSNLVSQAGVDITTHDPYVEAVLSHLDSTQSYIRGRCYLTQIRAGEKVPVGKDYIPHHVRVKKILVASGDLLEWEKQVKEIEEGTVVVHIGGTLISHYGVHCMTNKVPCLTTFTPEIGEVLEPTPPIVDPDPYAVIEGLAIGAAGVGLIHKEVLGDKTKYIHTDAACLVLMTVLHNAKAMSGSDGFWIGVAAALMQRVGMAASHGEARHARGKNLERETVYEMALKDFFSSRNLLGHAQERFLNYQWQGSFGGKKWADCTDSTMKLDMCIRELFKNPTVKNVDKLTAQLNIVVNKAHNGGWWLNKFIAPESFTEASNQSLYTLMLAAPAYYTIAQLRKTVDTKPIIEKWQSAGDIQVLYSQWLGQDPEKPEPKLKGHSEKKNYKELSNKDSCDVCGDPECTECKAHVPHDGENKYTSPTISWQGKKLNGIVPLKKVEAGDILAAQCVVGDGKEVHVQFRMNDMDGYYSFDTKAEKIKPTLNYYKYSCKSFSGSGEWYMQLAVVHSGDYLHFCDTVSAGLKIVVPKQTILDAVNAEVPNVTTQEVQETY